MVGECLIGLDWYIIKPIVSHIYTQPGVTSMKRITINNIDNIEIENDDNKLYVMSWDRTRHNYKKPLLLCNSSYNREDPVSWTWQPLDKNLRGSAYDLSGANRLIKKELIRETLRLEATQDTVYQFKTLAGALSFMAKTIREL